MDCLFNPSKYDESFSLYEADLLETKDKLMINEFKIKSLIARGEFSEAQINVALHTKSKKYYAIRQLDLEKEVDLKFVFKELIMQKLLRHNNILKIIHIIQDGTLINCVYPLMAYGSCADILKRHFISGFSENFIVLIVREVLLALIYLHNQDIVHCCVKSSHILISSTGTVKLTGFTCVQKQRTPSLRINKLFMLPERYTNFLRWASPEILAQDLQGYSELTDIYSLGITVCELGNSIVPFSDMPPTQMHLEKHLGTRPKILEGKPHVIVEGSIINDTGDTDENFSELSEHSKQHTYSFRFKQFIGLCLKSQTTRKTAIQMINLQLFKEIRRRKIEHDILKELIHLEKYPLKTSKVTQIPKLELSVSKKLTSNYTENNKMKTGSQIMEINIKSKTELTTPTSLKWDFSENIIQSKTNGISKRKSNELEFENRSINQSENSIQRGKNI